MADVGLELALFIQFVDQPGALFIIQPTSLSRAIGQNEKAGDSQQYGGDTLKNEQPMPAPHAHPAVQGQEVARKR